MPANHESTQHRMKDEYCHEHGGWGSSDTPCKACGSLSLENTMPPIPESLSFDEALKWGAEQITEEIKLNATETNGGFQTTHDVR